MSTIIDTSAQGSQVATHFEACRIDEGAIGRERIRTAP
jgi:hypothetical protein